MRTPTDFWWLRPGAFSGVGLSSSSAGAPRTPFTLHEFFSTPDYSWVNQVQTPVRAAAEAGPTPIAGAGGGGGGGLPPPDIPPETTSPGDYATGVYPRGFGSPEVTVTGGSPRGGTVSGIDLTNPPSGLGSFHEVRPAAPAPEEGEPSPSPAPEEANVGNAVPLRPISVVNQPTPPGPSVYFPSTVTTTYNPATGQFETPGQTEAYQQSHAQNLAMMDYQAMHQPTNNPRYAPVEGTSTQGRFFSGVYAIDPNSGLIVQTGGRTPGARTQLFANQGSYRDFLQQLYSRPYGGPTSVEQLANRGRGAAQPQSAEGGG